MKIEELLRKVPIKVFNRGKEILEEGKILEMESKENTVKAYVQGSYLSKYLVRIRLEGEEVLDWTCTCPYDEDICKHVVGVLLKVAHEKNLKVQRRKRKTKNELAEEIVDKLSHEELKEFVKNFLHFDRDM